MPQKRNPGKRRKIRPCSSKEVCEGTGDNAASITLLPVATQSLDPRHWNYTLTLPNHTTFLSVCYHGRNKITHNTKFKKNAFSNYGVRLELFCCIIWNILLHFHMSGFYGIEIWRQWLPGASLYPTPSCTTDMRKQLKFWMDCLYVIRFFFWTVSNKKSVLQ